MEQANLAAANNLVAILGVLALVVVILAVMLVQLKGKLNALQAKYDFFTQGEEANIDTVLTNTLQELQATKAVLAALQEKHAKLHTQVQGCLVHAVLVG